MSEFITVSGEETVEITLRPNDVPNTHGESVFPFIEAAITEDLLQHATAIEVVVQESVETRATVVGYLLGIRHRLRTLGTGASVVYRYSEEIREKLQEMHAISIFEQS